MLTSMLKTLEGKTTSIVFPEGNEPRVLKAAVRLYNDGFVTPVLLGNVDEVKAVADYISDEDNNHDGAAKMIEKIALR